VPRRPAGPDHAPQLSMSLHRSPRC
jgi:hypothetical protein